MHIVFGPQGILEQKFTAMAKIKNLNLAVIKNIRQKNRDSDSFLDAFSISVL